jgi:hypothetical protein
MLAQMGPPDFPTPIGVLRAVEAPRYDEGVTRQIEQQIEIQGQGSLEDLIYSGELWTVGEGGEISGGRA